MLLSLLLIALGVALLVVGADALVSGATRIAGRFGIPPLIIGLTIVAIGTSMPEIVVSTTAALGGSSELALGNVVGSNISNVLLILGIAAIILPLSAAVSVIRQEVPVMVGFSVLLILSILDGALSAFEAGVLLALGVGYLLLLIAQARRAARAGREVAVDLPEPEGWLARVPAPLLIGLGIVGLVGGAQLLVNGASAPAQLLEFHLPFMVVVAAALLPLVYTGYEISRAEGLLLLCWCAVYLVWTVLAATGAALLGTWSSIATFVLLPATAVFLVVTVWRAWRSEDRGPATM